MATIRWKRTLACLISAGASIASQAAAAQELSEGLNERIALAPFRETSETCAPPIGKSRTLLFLQDNERDFMVGVHRGLAAAAANRGLQYQRLLAQNDSNVMNSNAENAKENNAGAVVVAPIDSVSLAPRLKALLREGVFVGAIVPPPATLILNAPQFQTGTLLGEAAARHIETKLNGKARVVILTHDTNQYLAPRFAAIRKALKKAPGAIVIADISPMTVDRKGGYDVMQKILLASPRIDVVLGADAVVLGALDAVRKAGAVHKDQFFGGIDGEPDALKELRKHGEYKATVSLSSPVFAYAMGQYAADWLEGRSIPQAMDILPRLVTVETLAAFEADSAEPSAVYGDRARQESYLRKYGNICAESRDRFINFPWSSETK